MRFAAISILATIASAAFSFAAPLSPATNALEARGCGCQDIQSVITHTTTALAPHIQKLTYVNSDNCTAAVLGPVLHDITEVLEVAIEDVAGLVGLALEIVLTTVDGVLLTVSDVAGLVCGLLELIFGAIYVVLKLVSVVEKQVVYGLLVALLQVVAKLLFAILALVDGLLVALLALVGGVIIEVISILSLQSTFYCFKTLY